MVTQGAGRRVLSAGPGKAGVSRARGLEPSPGAGGIAVLRGLGLCSVGLGRLSLWAASEKVMEGAAQQHGRQAGS